MLKGLVREGSFKWLLGRRSSFDEEFEEIGRSPSAQRNWIPELLQLQILLFADAQQIIIIYINIINNFAFQKQEEMFIMCVCLYF